MNVDKKKIILIIIILLIVLVIILVNAFRKPTSNYEVTPVDIYDDYMKNRSAEGVSAKDAVAQRVNSMNEYYTIKGIVDQFNQNIRYLKASVDDLDLIISNKGEEAEILQEYKELGCEFILDVLATSYKEKYSINEKYVYDNLSKYAKSTYTITDMFVVYDSDFVNTFFVYGAYGSETFNMVIVLDRYRNTFEIYLNNYFEEQGYSLQDTKTMKTLEVNEIASNENNAFQYRNVDKEQIVNIYFDDYTDLAKNNIKAAYDKLDTEYSKNRFANIEEFTSLITSRVNDEYATLENYVKTQASGYDEYVCKDSKGNVYVFKVYGAMNYSVMLDSYTESVVAYENEYNNAEEGHKAELCISKFFECLNDGNYEKAYSYLNETYRSTKFKSVEAFEAYVKEYWFNTNCFEYQNTEKTTSGTYKVYGMLYDLKDISSFNAVPINMTIYVRLGAAYNDFEISF